MPDKNYSHRDVTDKLGLKEGMNVRVIDVGATHASPHLYQAKAFSVGNANNN